MSVAFVFVSRMYFTPVTETLYSNSSRIEKYDVFMSRSVQLALYTKVLFTVRSCAEYIDTAMTCSPAGICCLY